jgi:hypothetical protein
MLYYWNHLDLPGVPKVYLYYGWESWLLHAEYGCIFQAVSACFSLFRFVSLQKERGVRIHVSFKFLTALSFIAPMFGMYMFDLSGKVFFAAGLWNFFMGCSLAFIYKTDLLN